MKSCGGGGEGCARKFGSLVFRFALYKGPTFKSTRNFRETTGEGIVDLRIRHKLTRTGDVRVHQFQWQV